jgi:hypothetical protein
MERIGNMMQRRREKVDESWKRRNMNSLLIEQYKERAILFNPRLGRISGSAEAGLLMSQLLFWHGKGRNKERFYKTVNELQMETCLTRSEQNIAIKKWKNLGVLDVQKKGVPQKRNFYINMESLHELMKAYPPKEATLKTVESSQD